MKSNFFSKIVLSALLVAGLASCEKEQDETPVLETTAVESKMLAWDQIPNELTSENGTVAKNYYLEPTQKWTTIEDGESYFYRIGDKIYEEVNGQVTFTFDIWNDTHPSAIYANDGVRHLNISLPLGANGEIGQAYWWSHEDREWKTWRQFKYIDYKPTQKWNTTEVGESSFYRIDDIIYEEVNGKILFTFEVWNETDNAVYSNDITRHLNLQLAKTANGAKGRAYWWSHEDRVWNPWREFFYVPVSN